MNHLMPLRLAVIMLCLCLVLLGLLCAPARVADAQAAQPRPATNAQCPPFPLPNPSQVGINAFEPKLLQFLQGRCYNSWAADREIRNTGPVVGFLGFGTQRPGAVSNLGTHPAVRVFYSPEVWDWMKNRNRQGELPDGAMIIKEQYSVPADNSGKAALNGWSIMVRDKQGSWDGWYWDGPGVGDTPANFNIANFDYKGRGFGTYCMRCHASAADKTSTFSAIKNVEGDPITFFINVPTTKPPQVALTVVRPDLHESTHSMHMEELADVQQARAFPANVVPFPHEMNDHVPSGPHGPGQFLTSDQCIGCHAASDQNMGYTFTSPPINLSPYTEWRTSMMGLAGRDPIFHAQLESERAQFPDQAGFFDNKCLHCHGVMGQRQFAIDNGQLPAPEFSHTMLYQSTGDPFAKYGALARDGVSCTVCHQMSAEGLGTPASYTGNFQVDPPGTVNGPFDDPQPLPMQNALGINPRGAAHIKSSAMCGSCHTVITPTLDNKGNPVMENGKPKEFHEQTTYFEWQNSVYQDERAPVDRQRRQSCQDCHMPKMYKGVPLAFRIANIEDITYPFVDFRAPDKDITLKVRDSFSRHTLVALNLFANQMFQQFNCVMGVADSDYMYPYALDGSTPITGLVTNMNSSLELADDTADVDVQSINKTTNTLDVTVRVTNKAGHSFPSGVEFRRAFVEFVVLDAQGRALWASGQTNTKGEIIEGVSGAVLPTEYFNNDPRLGQDFQPHYFKGAGSQQGRAITEQYQVQIYEELVKDSDGKFTNSFVRLDEHVKDNRLLPLGWRTNGHNAQFTSPFGAARARPRLHQPERLARHEHNALPRAARARPRRGQRPRHAALSNDPALLSQGSLLPTRQTPAAFADARNHAPQIPRRQFESKRHARGQLGLKHQVRHARPRRRSKQVMRGATVLPRSTQPVSIKIKQ